MFVNTHEFSPAAKEKIQTGVYISAPYGSKEYMEYWGEQDRRCMEGFSVGGVRITGYHYYFLNFSPIEVVVDPKNPASEKRRMFPRFWDLHYDFFHHLEVAERAGKHFVLLKPRGTGFSEIMATIASHNYTIFRGSKSFFFASNEAYLNKDGVLTKAWDRLNFLNIETQRAYRHLRQVKDQDLHKRASHLNGDGDEIGYKSEIIGRVIDHPRKVRGARTGSRGKVYFEEGGSFPRVRESVSATRPLVEQGGVTTGQIIIWGTGGEEGVGIEGLDHIFRHPDAYNMYAFRNIWDEEATETECGWFFPRYACMDRFMDDDGNSDEDAAKAFEDAERAKIRKSSPKDEDLYIAENPYCIHPDSWISLSEQPLIRIKDISNKYDNGVQDRYKIITAFGREMITTHTHKFLSNGDYVSVKDLKIGDPLEVLPIVFNQKYQTIPIPILNGVQAKIVINKDWGRFLGLFMGDGSFYNQQLTISFDQKDIESIDWYINFCRKYFTEPQVRYPTKGGAEVRFSNNNLRDFISLPLELIFPRNSRYNKYGIRRKVHVPDYIIKSPKEVIRAFLQGIFDADGCVYTSARRVTMYSKHLTFLQDIQMLLTGFGIDSGIRSQTKINSNGYEYNGQSLELNAYNSNIFTKEIKFISTRKNKTLFRHKDVPVRNRKPLQDTIKSIEYHDKGQVYDVTTGMGYYSLAGINTHNTPMEALQRVSDNLFPVAELQRQLLRVQTDRSIKGFLKNGRVIPNENGKMSFILDPKARPVNQYPHGEQDNLTGCFTMVESPWKDQNGNVPRGLYQLVVDPYYKDDAKDKTSLGACYVYKHRNNITESEDNILVGWYVGRPPTTNEFIRNVFNIARFYNGMIQSEISGGGKGLIDYARVHKLMEYCELEPDIIYNTQSGTKRNKSYFIDMNTDRVKLALVYLADWLREERSLREDENGEIVVTYNLNKIYDEGFLKECIRFNDDGNFDRISALRILPFMIKKKIEHEIARRYEDSFWTRQLFSDNIHYDGNKLRPDELKDTFDVEMQEKREELGEDVWNW